MAEQCIALCDFEGQSPDELSFVKGERITVLAKGGDAGFWEGFIEGPIPETLRPLYGSVSRSSSSSPSSAAKERSGRFPSCMVTSNMNPDREPVFVDKAMALYDYTPQDETEMAMTKGDILTVVRPHPTSPGWWVGVNESELARQGKPTNVAPMYAPGSATRRRGSTTEPGKVTGSVPVSAAGGIGGSAASSSTDLESKIFPCNFVTSRLVMALFPFQGRHAHELSFQVRDVILVHRRWNDGWWEGTLKGKRGIFPSNYTAPNVATLDLPFFCQRCKTVFPPSTWECRECARNEEIVKTMLQAVEDHVNHVGTSTKQDALGNAECDIFAYVDVDPKYGRGALLTMTDTLDKSTIGPRNS
jgi:hypothetical protein